MTESRRVVGVRGSVFSVGATSARSGRGLDQEAWGQRGRMSQHGAHAVPSHTGKHGDRSGVHKDQLGTPLGSVCD
jgi:hypothetical protein